MGAEDLTHEHTIVRINQLVTTCKAAEQQLAVARGKLTERIEALKKQINDSDLSPESKSRFDEELVQPLIAQL